MAESEFNVGDVVQLPGLDPNTKMVITKKDQAGNCECVWLNKNLDLCRAEFDPRVFKKR